MADTCFHFRNIVEWNISFYIMRNKTDPRKIHQIPWNVHQFHYQQFALCTVFQIKINCLDGLEIWKLKTGPCRGAGWCHAVPGEGGRGECNRNWPRYIEMQETLNEQDDFRVTTNGYGSKDNSSLINESGHHNSNLMQKHINYLNNEKIKVTINSSNVFIIYFLFPDFRGLNNLF
jgi:hypothetical protein